MTFSHPTQILYMSEEENSVCDSDSPIFSQEIKIFTYKYRKSHNKIGIKGSLNQVSTVKGVYKTKM